MQVTLHYEAIVMQVTLHDKRIVMQVTLHYEAILMLGHHVDPVLNVLKDNLGIENKSQSMFCETCQRAKQTREPFPLSDHKSFKLGDLIHLDLWGPYNVSSSKGSNQRKSGYSLYTKSVKGVFLALLVYVDDIIITGDNVSEIEMFKVYLKYKFMIKYLGKLKYFFGIEVILTSKGICLKQRKYVLDLLSKYGMLACKHAKAPLMSKIIISNEVTDIDSILDNITDYKKLMGLGIHIVKNSAMNLLAFSDADWAKCVIQRKSVTGYCVFLNNSLVSWKSKKQNTLLNSSTKAEYRALALVTSEVIWILKFLKD
nr:hypothetical protein [Tanacetum cinerariifolium]